MHQNCRGLFNNIPNLTTLFSGRKNTVITLSETLIDSHSTYDNDSLYEIQGFSFIKKNRANGKGGGVAMYISDDVNWKRRTDLENTNIECIVIEIFPNKAKSFIVRCIYRPQDRSHHLPKNWRSNFTELLMSVIDCEKETILLGDMNINYLQRANNPDIKDIIIGQGFEQLIKNPN